MNLVEFRGAMIPKEESDVLKVIECTIKYPMAAIHEKFELVNSIEYYPENIYSTGVLNGIHDQWYHISPALFVVENNRVVKLGFHDPNDCESCYDKDSGWHHSESMPCC